MAAAAAPPSSRISTSRRSCAATADGRAALTSDASLADAHRRVLGRIDAACLRAGRDPSSVQLVAVTKSVALERVRDGIGAGLTTLGENRVQEAADKIAALPDAEWHLVGRLQGNKAARALALFDVIQSVDSLDLARRLDRLAGQREPGHAPLPVYLQVNVDDDPHKAGFAQADLERQIDELTALPSLELRGLMTVGRLVDRPEDARSTFLSLAGLSAQLRAGAPALGPGLSMGMTDDFEIAVEEGATVVRIGRALFGHRHDHDH